MSDRFFDGLERELIAAERRLAPPIRRRAGRLARRGALIPAVIVVVAVPAVAATTQSWDPFSGPRDSEKVAITAPIPRVDDRPSPAGDVPEVGVIHYRSRGGKVCLAAGLVKDGRVGQMTRGGFYPLNAADAAATCGDPAETLAKFGGTAVAQEGYSEHDRNVFQSIVYGLTASRSTRVRVTWRDGRTETVPVKPTDAPEDLQGAEGVYAVAGRPGTISRRAKVELLAPDDTVIHTFEF